jgi:DNA-binding CsgD family transcriptional regulator
VQAVRAGLVGLFADVDRVSLSVNFACRIDDPGANKELITVVMQCPASGHLYIRDVPSDDGGLDPNIRRLMENIVEQRFPLQEYHPPVAFAYYFGGIGYLGAIFLWRDVGRPPISETTRSAMAGLHRFFVFLLTDYVARARYAQPNHFTSIENVDELLNAYRLTRQERRLVLLLALGLSYKEMAETMNISVNTLRYHRRSLYTKVGVHSHHELLAQIFAPKISG